MQSIFNACVMFLLLLAHILGVSYQTINVLIFCILWPGFTIYLVIRVVQLKYRIREPALFKTTIQHVDTQANALQATEAEIRCGLGDPASGSTALPRATDRDVYWGGDTFR